MPAPKKYGLETQARVVLMFADRTAEGDVSQIAARKEVGGLFGIKEATLGNWIRRDAGEGYDGCMPTSLCRRTDLGHQSESHCLRWPL